MSMPLILDTGHNSLIKYSEQTILLELPGEFQRTLQPIRFKYSLRPWYTVFWFVPMGDIRNQGAPASVSLWNNWLYNADPRPHFTVMSPCYSYRIDFTVFKFALFILFTWVNQNVSFMCQMYKSVKLKLCGDLSLPMISFWLDKIVREVMIAAPVSL